MPDRARTAHREYVPHLGQGDRRVGADYQPKFTHEDLDRIVDELLQRSTDLAGDGRWDFVHVADYGASLDADGVGDVSSVSASNQFTSATAQWAAGQVLVVRGAGASGATFVGTIASVSGTTATCGAAETAGTTASNLQGFYGTDDTSSWQAALNAAAPGDVVDAGPSWRSMCIGQLSVPQNVKLVRSGSGPHDPQSNPAYDAFGPTFVMVQNNTTAFVTLNHGSGVGDAIFYSANQLHPSNSTPTTFRPVIAMPAGTAGCYIDQPYIPNAWIGIAVQGGRHHINRPCIGAFFRALTIDQSLDYVNIGTLLVQVYWNIVEGRPVGTTGFDAFVLNNLWAVEIGRSDAFAIDNLLCHRAFGTIVLADSPDAALPIRPGYGVIGRIDADSVAYGIYAISTAAPGVLIGAALIGANGTGGGTPGQAAIITVAGGTIPPKIVLKSWSHRGSWVGPASVNNAGTLIVPGTNPG